ncbi:hypothetical protein Tco_0555964 [Tanacetum coccineum]
MGWGVGSLKSWKCVRLLVEANLLKFITCAISQKEEEESAEDALIRKKGKALDKEELKELMSFEPSSSTPKPKTDQDVYATLKKVVPLMIYKTTNDIVKKNLPKFVADAIRSERQKVQQNIAAMVADVVDSNLRNYMSNHILHVHPTSSTSSSIPDLQHQLYLRMKDDEQAHNVDLEICLSLKIKFEKPVPLVEPCRVVVVHTRDHEDHHDDDARPNGEISNQEQLVDFNAWQDDQGIDDDEVPFKEVSPELLDEVSGKLMTTDDLQRTKNVLTVMMRNQCDSVEEHQYHLDQMQSYMESQIVWESEVEYLTKHIPKKPTPIFLSCLHAFPFPENNLEELNTRWVKRTIKRFNLYARYVVRHWKTPWAQQAHIRRQLKQKDDPKEVYSKKKIIDVIRVLSNQGYGQEYIEEIVVKRANRKYLEFTESDYKYLHKNDIEDMYWMCSNGKIKDYQETGLLKSLIIFIRSCVIWVRVHDYQLGLESYQRKVNLTAPTLTFPSIEKEKLLTMTSDLVVGLIYENSKKEKRHGYADPDLSKEDAEYMMFYEDYIQERLRHHDQMRHWESYVNGRPL